MSRRLLFVLAGLVLLGGLLAAAPGRDVETLLREAHLAFERGDFEAAGALYEQAELHSTEPSLVAYDLATVKYHLALANSEGKAVALQQAEELFRCCLESSDPRHDRALFGLGNCLARKADPARPDLLAALECYDRCLQSGTTNAELLEAARQQRELVRLHLLQFQPRQRKQDQANEENNDTKPGKPDRDPMSTQATQGTPNGPHRGKERTAATQVKPDQNQTPQPGKDPLPGSGNLPVIPDRGDLQALPPRDAADHLDLAARRILEDERAHQKSRARPFAAGVRDW